MLQRELGQHDKPVEGFQAAEFGDAYVFRSTWVHKVSPVRSGQRRVLVLEFWQAPDNPLPKRASAQSWDFLFFSGVLTLLSGLAVGAIFAFALRRVFNLHGKPKRS